jgi:hypothetical protein
MSTDGPSGQPDEEPAVCIDDMQKVLDRYQPAG